MMQKKKEPLPEVTDLAETCGGYNFAIEQAIERMAKSAPKKEETSAPELRHRDTGDWLK